MKIFTILLLTFCAPCLNYQAAFSFLGTVSDQVVTAACNTTMIESSASQNIFIDSTSIGLAGTYKVMVEDVGENEEDHLICIQLFNRVNNKWLEIQNCTIPSTSLSMSYPEFSDFNNDGWNDLTVRSANSARGANDLRTLFIFDPANQCFIHIINSEAYPNLAYNERTNGLTAWRFYGRTSTVFLEIVNDSLNVIGEVVDYDNKRTAYDIDYAGNRKVISSDTLGDPLGFDRYCNYRPIETCYE